MTPPTPQPRAQTNAERNHYALIAQAAKDTHHSVEGLLYFRHPLTLAEAYCSPDDPDLILAIFEQGYLIGVSADAAIDSLESDRADYERRISAADAALRRD